MKYSNTNLPLSCLQTNSTCYKGTTTMNVKGVLWHSTGANNPTLKRYVQPLQGEVIAGELGYDALMALLGTNTNGNDWNHTTIQAGLNGWIGKLADGSVTSVKTMPWNYRPWGCGSGSKGSCNDGWIQFEICEDACTDATYFNSVYQEACELTAYLCKEYNLDPYGTASVGSTSAPVILCHNDAYNLGVGSGHADVMHWFPSFGKSMATVRDDVYNIINQSSDVEPTTPEIVVPTVTPTVPDTSVSTSQTLTLESFSNMMTAYQKDLSLKAPSDWSSEAREWAENLGIISGDESGNLMYQKGVTRQELIQILYVLFCKKGLK